MQGYQNFRLYGNSTRRTGPKAGTHGPLLYFLRRRLLRRPRKGPRSRNIRRHAIKNARAHLERPVSDAFAGYLQDSPCIQPPSVAGTCETTFGSPSAGRTGRPLSSGRDQASPLQHLAAPRVWLQGSPTPPATAPSTVTEARSPRCRPSPVPNSWRPPR
jgi:hypothetical protein